ncbi:hypothetical protein OIU74_006873 [Salix koriyanagi]|uniref:Uncharacterized protein n=1 Tax=Salix koriyanagi TaxID=2511006 RepID=A0A9Q0UFG2_9ROSI|nr:hypothetical protein OIU74_006873 [Salix koriyanagi]
MQQSSFNPEGEKKSYYLKEFTRTKAISLRTQGYTVQFCILNLKNCTLSTSLDCLDLSCNVCAYPVFCLFHFLVPF